MLRGTELHLRPCQVCQIAPDGTVYAPRGAPRCHGMEHVRIMRGTTRCRIIRHTQPVLPGCSARVARPQTTVDICPFNSVALRNTRRCALRQPHQTHPVREASSITNVRVCRRATRVIHRADIEGRATPTNIREPRSHFVLFRASGIGGTVCTMPNHLICFDTRYCHAVRDLCTG